MTAASLLLVAHGPDWAAKLEAFSALGTGVVILVTAVVGAFALADAKKTRHGQLLVSLSGAWEAKATRDSVAKKADWQDETLLSLVRAVMTPGRHRTDTQLNTYMELMIFPNLLETLGVYVDEGVVSEELVFRMWGASIIDSWKHWSAALLLERELTGHPGAFMYFEALAAKMNEREEELRVQSSFAARMAGRGPGPS